MLSTNMRRWVLFVGAVMVVLLGYQVGMALMAKTMEIFDIARETAAGSNTDFLVTVLYPGIRAIMGWIVFGLVMTNATIVASAIGVVMMLSPREDEQDD